MAYWINVESRGRAVFTAGLKSCVFYVFRGFLAALYYKQFIVQQQQLQMFEEEVWKIGQFHEFSLSFFQVKIRDTK